MERVHHIFEGLERVMKVVVKTLVGDTDVLILKKSVEDLEPNDERYPG